MENMVTVHKRERIFIVINLTHANLALKFQVLFFRFDQRPVHLVKFSL
jgi:hypothetical protein